PQSSAVFPYTTLFRSDLVRLAGLDWLPLWLQPEVELVAVSVFTALDETAGMSEDDLFGDSQLPNMALIGTSFSRHSNFVPFLERSEEHTSELQSRENL